MILEISFVSVFLTTILFDRLISCLSVLVLGLVRPDLAPLRKSRLHTYAGLQFAGSFTPLAGAVITSVVDAVLTAMSVLATVSVFAAIFTVIFTTLYLVFEYTPESAINFALYWNEFLGPALQIVIFAPLRLLGTIIRPVLALYNFVVYVVSRGATQVVVLGSVEQLAALQQFSAAFAGLIQNISLSIFHFAYAIFVNCDEDPLFAGDLCFEIGPREFDLLTPMDNVAVMAKSVGLAITGVCGAASAPLDILLYPLTDADIKRGAHDILNAALFTLFHVPVVTTKRCNAYRSVDVMMCLPDFEPSFDFLARGLRSFGLGVDTWINVASVRIRAAVGLDVPSCSTSDGGMTASSYNRALFGTRQLSVVGMTDLIYGVTDGISVQYFSHSNRFESVIAPNAWPIQVDTRHGIASVLYNSYVDEPDEVGNQRTSMMGCRCVDDDVSGEMRIECAFALYGDDGTFVPSFEAVFAKKSTAKYLTCKQVSFPQPYSHMYDHCPLTIILHVLCRSRSVCRACVGLQAASSRATRKICEAPVSPRVTAAAWMRLCMCSRFARRTPPLARAACLLLRRQTAIPTALLRG